jgi:hypothetical protein
MELQSEGEGNGTYSATGMAISEWIGMGANISLLKIPLVWPFFSWNFISSTKQKSE